MSIVDHLLGEFLADFRFSSIRLLWQRNLPLLIHRLRIAAWVLIAIGLGCLGSVYLFTLDPQIRWLLKGIVIGCPILIFAILVCMGVVMKKLEEAESQ